MAQVIVTARDAKWVYYNYVSSTGGMGSASKAPRSTFAHLVSEGELTIKKDFGVILKHTPVQ